MIQKTKLDHDRAFTATETTVTQWHLVTWLTYLAYVDYVSYLQLQQIQDNYHDDGNCSPDVAQTVVCVVT